jgi:transposase
LSGTARKLLQSKAIAIENELRASLRNFGLKVGMVGTMKFEARIRELVERLPDLAVLVEPLLTVRRVIREQLGILHRRLLAIVRDDEVCRRLTTIPGVAPCGRTDLSRDRRCTGPLQEVQGGRGGVWTHTR